MNNTLQRKVFIKYFDIFFRRPIRLKSYNEVSVLSNEFIVNCNFYQEWVCSLYQTV